MSAINAVMLSVLVIPCLPCSLPMTIAKNRADQQEIRILQQRDNTRIKLAIIAAIVSLGTAKILHTSGHLQEFNALIHYLLQK